MASDQVVSVIRVRPADAGRLTRIARRRERAPRRRADEVPAPNREPVPGFGCS